MAADCPLCQGVIAPKLGMEYENFQRWWLEEHIAHSGKSKITDGKGNKLGINGHGLGKEKAKAIASVALIRPR